MKHTRLLAISLIPTLCATGAYAAPDTHIHTNAIVAHNIATTQHMVTQTVFSSFTNPARSVTHHRRTQSTQHDNTDPSTLYGRAPMYGTAPMYGEYNDDGSAGRSGGDTFNARTTLNNLWLNWQHSDDKAHIDKLSQINSDTDTFMFGVAGGQTKHTNNLSKWGMYVGFIDATQNNHDLDIKSQGGYFGIYNGNTIGKFGIQTTINGGAQNNSSETIYGTDEHSNFWAGAAAEFTYDFTLDNTFTLQPGINIGYTWIRGENYTSTSGDTLKNNEFSMLEVIPTLRAIKHIANGWFGVIDAKYVITYDDGGDTSVNGISTDPLHTGNYREYGISLEKHIDALDISAHISRRDGARDGWIGGMNIKYAF